jgi:biotin/methionine sulfoxide reductase
VANDRGSCLAAATVTDGILAGVVQLPTGAWFDPADPAAVKPFCVHGNPNVLTRDSGTSSLAQGCTGQHTVVEVSRYTGVLPHRPGGLQQGDTAATGLEQCHPAAMWT